MEKLNQDSNEYWKERERAEGYRDGLAEKLNEARSLGDEGKKLAVDLQSESSKTDKYIEAKDNHTQSNLGGRINKIYDKVRKLKTEKTIYRYAFCKTPSWSDGILAVLEGDSEDELIWDIEKYNDALFSHPSQIEGEEAISGEKLREYIKENNIPVFGANIYEYLVNHPLQIPEKWIGKTVYFWGTIFRKTVDKEPAILSIQPLGNGKFIEGACSLKKIFGKNDVAAIERK